MFRITWAFIVYITLLSQTSFAIDFPCQKRIEETKDYLHCLNKIESYPENIHFYYPKNLELNKPVKVNIHFHGHNLNGFSHFDKSYGDYGVYLIESHFNGVLVIPESKGKCNTYDSFFNDEISGIKFIKDIINLNFTSVNSVSFSGHSGAYRVLNKIFSYKKLEFTLEVQIIGVGLFDATYATINPILNFAQKKTEFVFFDSYVHGKNGTTDEISNYLKLQLDNNENYYFLPIKSNNDSVLEQHFNTLKFPGIKRYLEILESKSSSNF